VLRTDPLEGAKPLCARIAAARAVLVAGITE
jgi:hypothetical protein